MIQKSSRGRVVRVVALSLAAALAAGACNSGGDKKPTAVKTEESGSAEGSSAKKGSVTVTALATKGDATEGVIGVSNEITINVGPSSKDALQVGFVDDEVSGTGAQWRASGWMGTAVAVLVSGESPNGKQVNFENSGFTEGPSAGALVTVGVLSVLRGEKIKPDVTMTGTINPDGTIGPVGGIPQKIDGAKGAKKKVMLIPAGQRTSTDAKTNQPVDVIEAGRVKGVEVREVGDIYEAYEAFTGKELPRPSDDGFKAELDKQAFDRIAARTKEWLGRYEDARGQYAGVAPEFADDDYDAEMASAAELAASAKSLSDQGLEVRAYGKAVNAAVAAGTTVQTVKLVETAVNRGRDGVLASLDAAGSASTKVTALVDVLKGEKPENVSDYAGVMSAYGSAVDAISLLRFADAIKRGENPGSTGGGSSSPLGRVTLGAAAAEEESGIPGLTMAQLEAAFTATLYYRLAELYVEFAKDQLAFGTDLEGPKLAKGVDVTSVADFFRRAAEANFNLFETVFTEPTAERVGKSKGIIQDRLRQADYDYALAGASIENVEILKEYFKDETALSYAKLGSSVSLYARSGGLLAKYYSLQAEVDENLNVVSIPREKALLAMLDLADDNVKRGAAVLDRNKVSPSTVIAQYESARGSREEGEASLKLDALTEFWTAYVQSRVLSYLGGFSKKV